MPARPKVNLFHMFPALIRCFTTRIRRRWALTVAGQVSGEGSKGFLGMVLKPDLVKAIVNIVEGDNALADD